MCQTHHSVTKQIYLKAKGGNRSVDEVFNQFIIINLVVGLPFVLQFVPGYCVLYDIQDYFDSIIGYMYWSKME